jgi:XTP/dITP diphosphohydrolase
VKVVIATRNRHKVKEIAALLDEARLGIEAVTIDAIAPHAALLENEATFEGNALAKARQAAAACSLPAMADDSGIEVDALGGAPGVHSARWAGEPSDDGRNNQKMLRELASVPAAKRTARYRCVAAFVDPARGLEIIRAGACEGVLLDAPRGQAGFGYDPLFLVSSLGQTMAELDLPTKNRLSHRAAAFRALAQALRASGLKK